MNHFSSPSTAVDTSIQGLRFPEAEAADFAALELFSAEEILRWGLERWSRRLTLVTSFQAAGMVLLDMAWRIDPEVRIVTLDTGRLHQETHDLMDRVRDRYGVEIEIFSPDAGEVEALVRKGGPNLFYRSREDRKACCRVRKVAPLARALEGSQAWVTGLRRDQAPSRSGTPKAARELRRGLSRGPLSRVRLSDTLVKLSPLADWTEEDVWSYLKTRGVPVHSLYEEGYRSIGCQPCTRPTGAGEDPRAGRWWWEKTEHRECGLHLVQLGEAPKAGVSPGVLPGGAP